MVALFLLGAPLVDAAVSSTEHGALVALYNGTNGASWTNKANWLIAVDECTWFGVSCDTGHTTVTRVALGSNQLSGTIPTQVGSLPNLSYLDLSNNHLTGTIPTQLSNLSHLHVLALNGNQLTGTIPTQLGTLSALTILDLGSNQLTGAIPPELGGLVALTGLYLYNNALTGTLPSQLGALTQLQFLLLNANQLSGPIPPQFGNLTKLANMFLQGNQLSGNIPQALANLSALIGGSLSWNAVYTSDPTLQAFLTKALGSVWQTTQTVAPTSVSASGPTPSTITVSWIPIAYTAGSGFYQVFGSTTAGGPYVPLAMTSSKSSSSLAVAGLAANTRYYFVVNTTTQPNANNTNTVTSEFSAEISATTLPSAVPPTVTSFTAAPTTITSGQSSTLSWTTLNAQSVSISGVAGVQPANGSTAVYPTATTTYTLMATGPGGTAVANTPVNVLPSGSAPIASFTYSPASPKPGQPVTFTDTSSGTPTSWSWAFGDVGAANTATTIHAFTTTGTFTVALVVTNGFGTDSTSKQVRVTADVPALHADFTYSPTNPAAGAPVQFTDRSAGSPASWSWDFGDHTASTVSNPSHAFAAAGSYAVTLTVSNASAHDHTTQTLQVSSSGCSGNCLTLSGHATIRGSNVAITGSGSPARAVKLFDATLQVTSYVSPLGADGSYSIVAPAGTYTAVCDLSYTDKIELPGGGYMSPPPLRHALQARPLAGTSGSQILDFAFPLPIVFVHGIKSGPEKWDNWSSILGADQSGPDAIRDAIFFTPAYTDHYSDSISYPAEVASLSEELQADFSIFSQTPPFNIVAHSKGGLVARVYHGSSPDGGQVRHAVLLGTPNDGSNCFTVAEAENYDLSRCDLQNLNGQTPTWAPTKVLAIAGSKHVLPLECGGIIFSCKFESGPDDGAVPVDSVFKITTIVNGSPTTQLLPGFVVPFNHCELGSAASSWLFSSVVLPFFDDKPLVVNNKPVSCPPSYSTPAVSCTTDRPSASDYCYDGRGLNFDGGCTLGRRGETTSAVTVTWTSPGGGFNAAPGLPNASFGSAGACGPPISNLLGVTATDQPSLSGYQIYRAEHSIAAPDPTLRIGYAPAGQLSFVDPAPSIGQNYYAVSAIYNGGDSESSLASATPLTVSGRRRVAPH